METICKYISYEEATKSFTAINHGIDNTPNAAQLTCMKSVGKNIFDPLREYIGRPIKVESFFRCNKLNKLVGGSANSQHTYGQAIDIDDDFGYAKNNEMFYWLAKNVKFDQLLWEFGNGKSPAWIHVSYVDSNNRNKLSIAYKNSSNKSVYEHFYSLDAFTKRLNELYPNT